MPCTRSLLLVEDDAVDAIEIKRALHDAGIVDTVTHFTRAREALAHLRSSQNRSGLILLDLTMPDTDGLEFLEVVKNDPGLRGIPVVALTASEDPRHILGTFDRGIAGYMVKSSDYGNLVETLRAIQNYWSLSELPTYLA